MALQVRTTRLEGDGREENFISRQGDPASMVYAISGR